MKAMVGAGFIKLRVGDAIQHGDEYFDANTGEWEQSKCAGKHAVGKPNCTSSIYRRKCSRCQGSGSLTDPRDGEVFQCPTCSNARLDRQEEAR